MAKRNVLLEAVIGSAVLVLLFLLLHLPLMQVAPDWSMGHVGILTTLFVTGVLAHVIAEKTGLNRRFCDMVVGQ